MVTCGTESLLVELLAAGGIAKRKGTGRGNYSPEYKAYLKSPQWEAKRQQVLERDAHQCRGCGVGKGLQVHHIRYDNLGHEPLEDLTTLCTQCHRAVHRVISNRHRKKGRGKRG